MMARFACLSMRSPKSRSITGGRDESLLEESNASSADLTGLRDLTETSGLVVMTLQSIETVLYHLRQECITWKKKQLNQ